MKDMGDWSLPNHNKTKQTINSVYNFFQPHQREMSQLIVA